MEMINKHKQEFEKVLDFLKNELGIIRTGRANSSLIENCLVEAYGAKTALKGLATIGVPDARTMAVEPWDKSILKDIEKSLSIANLGFSITNEGNLLRLSIPLLTEESRKELVKVVNQKEEQARVKVRGVREKIREEIISAERNKEISEDDKYRLQEELDKVVGEYNKKIKEMGENKEKEIMTI